MLQNLKTSKKVSVYFSIFSFVSLIILLFGINIIYFSIWYNDQKKESLYDMNMSYSSYSKDGMDKSNIESFSDYILTKDSLITTTDGKEIASDSLLKKLNGDLNLLKNKIFYKFNGKTYLIFSKNYNEIGDVKILFDTTKYINSQMMIIKISLIIILFSVILNYFLGEFVVKKALKNLNLIKDYCQNLDLNNEIITLIIDGSEDDEIKIVADKLSSALHKIKSQNDNLKQFISDVSHEFKTPLMALNSKNDLIKTMIEKDRFSEENLNEFLEYNKYYIKKLDKILEVLILITRLKDKNIKLNLEKVDLKTHIERIIRDKNVENIKIIGNKSINIDIPTFDIMFENLLNNSIKYGENKEIIINLNEKSLAIKDNGIGIKKENLDKIFNNFFKENSESEGFGIGLYLVKRILDLYGWKIEVKSENGYGSEFIILF